MTSTDPGSFDALYEWLAAVTARGLIPVAVQGRISQDPDYTLSAVERHIGKCLARVAEHPEWVLVPVRGSLKDPSGPERGRWPDGVFVNNNTRATDARKLTEYHRLMALADAGLVKVIVAYNQARLWRQRTLRADGFARLAKGKVRLDSIMGPSLDLSKATERMLAGMIGEADEWYLEITREAQRDTALTHAQAGAWHGKRPFGFDLVPAPGPKRGAERSLTLREAEAGPLREVYVRIDPDRPASPQARRRGDPPRADGLRWSLWDACTWLDEQDVRTATGRTWREAGTDSLGDVLAAARNIGLREHTEGWDGSGHRPYVKRGAPELYPASWVPLLDDTDLFWRVREMLTDPARRRPGPKVQAQHLLTGLVFCGRCGHPMYVQHNRTKPSWTCQQCWTIRSRDQVTAEAERAIYAWLADNSPFDRAMAAAEPADLAGQRVELVSLRDDRNRILDDYYDRKITEADKGRQLARKNEQIAEIEAAMAGYDDELAALGVDARGDEFIRLWEGWREDGDAGLDERRRIAGLLIGRVVVYPAGRTNDPDPRLIAVEPGAWARRLPGTHQLAEPAVPDAAALTPRGQALAVLAGGAWLSTAGIGARLGRDPDGALKNLLRRMTEDGVIEREWFRYGLTADGMPATMEQARTASASGTLRGAGCHGFRITGGQADGSHAGTGVDQAAT